MKSRSFHNAHALVMLTLKVQTVQRDTIFKPSSNLSEVQLDRDVNVDCIQQVMNVMKQLFVKKVARNNNRYLQLLFRTKLICNSTSNITK